MGEGRGGSWLCRAFIIMLLFCVQTFSVAAQEVHLNIKDDRNRESVSVKLYDENEGDFILDLPLTFHITSNNILFMIVGDDNGVSGNNTVWMFDKKITLVDFLQRNKNVSSSKTFRKQINTLESFYYQSGNIERLNYFDSGYEYVQASPKPAFFIVDDPTKPITLKLKFYVSSEKNDYTHVLNYEAGTVRVTINILK